MKETVELRNKPELKIILNQDEFEIVDVSEPNNNGIYSLRHIQKVVLNEEKTNWIFSIFTLIVEFLPGSALVGGTFKNKANMEVEMVNRNLNIGLINADFEKAKRVSRILNGQNEN
jgi:hypothetical protein